MKILNIEIVLKSEDKGYTVCEGDVTCREIIYDLSKKELIKQLKEWINDLEQY